MAVSRGSAAGLRGSHRSAALWWWLGGALLFGVIALATAQGMGIIALALLVMTFGGLAVLLMPELGVIGLTATFFLGYLSALEGAGYLTINNLLGVVLLGLLLARMYGQGEVDVLYDRHLQLFAVICLLIILNQLMTADLTPPAELASLDLSQTRVQGIITKTAYAVFVVAFIRTRSAMTLLVVTLVAFVLMTAPNAIMNALSASATSLSNVEKIRAAADFGIKAARNANRLAFVSAVAITIIAFSMREFRSRLLRLGGLGAILLLVATIFLSASRSGLLNLIILTAVFMKKAGVRARTFAILGTLAILVAVAAVATSPDGPAGAIVDPVGTARNLLLTAGGNVIPQKYLDRITNLGVEHGEEGHGSTTARLQLLRTGMRIFTDHPLVGVGIGNFRWLAIESYQLDRISALHNSYVLMLVEGGLLLFIPYLVLYGYTWRSLRHTRRLALAHPEVRLGWVVEAVQSILLMFLIFSIFADLWHDIYPFLIVGLAGALAQIYRVRTRTSRA